MQNGLFLTLLISICYLEYREIYVLSQHTQILIFSVKAGRFGRSEKWPIELISSPTSPQFPI